MWKKRDREERRTGFVRAPNPKSRPSIALSVVAGTFLFLVTLSLFILAFGQVTVLEYLLTVMPQRSLQGVNILIAGIDAEPNSKRSDTIMIVHMDRLRNRIGVLSIPRDTRVKVDGMGYTKINHAYARGGIDLLQKTVSGFLGIPIHYYIQVDSTGVEQIIDEMGGLNFKVDKNMYYTDKAGDLYINLKKGDHQLSGRETVAYLRFRGDGQGDIGRIHRQQSFVQGFTGKIFGSSQIFLSPKIMGKLMKNIDTSLSPAQVISLAVQFDAAFKAGNIETNTVPGTAGFINGISYWKPDVLAMSRVINMDLFGIGKVDLVEPDSGTPAAPAEVAHTSAVTQVITRTLKPSLVENKVETPDQDASNDKRRVVTMVEARQIETQHGIDKGGNVALPSLSVEVLNGNGAHGGARTLAKYLKKNKIKVPWFRDAANFNYDETLIVDWRGNLEGVSKLAAFLGIDPSKIIVYDRKDKKIDASVIIGKDWDEILGKLGKEKQ